MWYNMQLKLEYAKICNLLFELILTNGEHFNYKNCFNKIIKLKKKL